jgi:hypothetical protein
VTGAHSMCYMSVFNLKNLYICNSSYFFYCTAKLVSLIRVYKVVCIHFKVFIFHESLDLCVIMSKTGALFLMRNTNVISNP